MDRQHAEQFLLGERGEGEKRKKKTELSAHGTYEERSRREAGLEPMRRDWDEGNTSEVDREKRIETFF